MLLKQILNSAMELHVPVKLSTFDCLNNHNSTIEIDAEDCRAILPLCGQELKNQFSDVRLRDLSSSMYKIENTENFIVNDNGFLYLIYAYGNTENTNKMDVIIFE